MFTLLQRHLTAFAFVADELSINHWRIVSDNQREARRDCDVLQEKLGKAFFVARLSLEVNNQIFKTFFESNQLHFSFSPIGSIARLLPRFLDCTILRTKQALHSRAHEESNQ